MCLMALALGLSSRWPLLMATNRDEFHERPTLALSRWTSADGNLVMSGRDLRAGGTWLGCSPTGRLALLTNVREGAALAGPRSRGELPLRWLASQQESETFLGNAVASDYAGCNLIMGDSASGQWTWASNRGNRASAWTSQSLRPGLYGLSNALLDTPWPKTLALKAAVAEALSAADQHLSAQKGAADVALAQLQSRLWAALGNRTLAAKNKLPSTGVEPELELGLSSAWVNLPVRGYGTRCSTLVWLDATPGQAPQLHMVEKTWIAGSEVPTEVALHWVLPGQ